MKLPLATYDNSDQFKWDLQSQNVNTSAFPNILAQNGFKIDGKNQGISEFNKRLFDGRRSEILAWPLVVPTEPLRMDGGFRLEAISRRGSTCRRGLFGSLRRKVFLLLAAVVLSAVCISNATDGNAPRGKKLQYQLVFSKGGIVENAEPMALIGCLSFLAGFLSSLVFPLRTRVSVGPKENNSPKMSFSRSNEKKGSASSSPQLNAGWRPKSRSSATRWGGGANTKEDHGSPSSRKSSSTSSSSSSSQYYMLSSFIQRSAANATWLFIGFMGFLVAFMAA
eukprot:jgi/Bigna1/142203/aug1.68_g16911